MRSSLIKCVEWCMNRFESEFAQEAENELGKWSLVSLQIFEDTNSVRLGLAPFRGCGIKGETVDKLFADLRQMCRRYKTNVVEANYPRNRIDGGKILHFDYERNHNCEIIFIDLHVVDIDTTVRIL
jgi:hypothetical protein